jgi:hypothetical protein
MVCVKKDQPKEGTHASRKNSIASTQVHQWACQRLRDAKLLKDHGPLCTAVVVWSVVLRAAARMSSVFAACRDLANAPCAQAVYNALSKGLPRTLKVLEKRLNWALVDTWPRRLQRRRWEAAIDIHLEPYYGQSQRSRNELCYGKPRPRGKESLPKRAPGYLRAAMLTQPQMVLVLRRPVRARGPYGLAKEVRRGGLAVDEADRLRAVLAERCPGV